MAATRTRTRDDEREPCPVCNAYTWCRGEWRTYAERPPGCDSDARGRRESKADPPYWR